MDTTQTGDVLHPPVAEGVVPVRPLGRQLEPQQGHHRGPGVGEVVESVGGDGDGAADEARQAFAGEEQQVQRDARAAAQHSIGPAARGIVHMVVVPDQARGKQFDHR